MRTLYAYLIPLVIMTFVFSLGLSAQETTVSVKVEKGGKVVKDTTYSFEDAEQAEHALMMMDMMGADDEHMMEIHKVMSENHGAHSKTMVFVSEDGKTTQIKEMSGDSLVWITEGDAADGKHVVLMKSGDGETYDILINEESESKDEDGNIVKTKEVKVIVTSDENEEE